MYINCHSYFSFRYGIYSPEDLVTDALDKQVEALALTDINNTSGVFDFIKTCHEKGVKPLIGVDFRNGNDQQFVALARNLTGFGEINKFLSHHLEHEIPMPAQAPEFENVFIIYPFAKEIPAVLRDYEYVGIKAHELSRLIQHPLLQQQDKLIMMHPVSFRDKQGFNAHRIMRAVELNTLISKLSPEDIAGPDEVMLQQDELLKCYSSRPRIIQNTMALIDRCDIKVKFHKSKNRRTFTGNHEDDRQLLRKLALDGMHRRYRRLTRTIQQRVEHELDIIDELGFSAYFLITWDIIRYAKSRAFRHVGRGSGANSIVAYCLQITDVDPIELDLYFERFINPYRTSPPDFDIDFSWDERDEVIDYIFKRYGRQHTALLATYNTFKGKSIIRELGKVFGLPKTEIDKLVKSPEQVQQYDKLTQMVFHYGKMIEKFPNYLSIHAGGILITEEPVYKYTATHLPPKGFPTTQFDMFVAEEVGFYKYDILSQRGLGHIKETIELVYRNRGKYVDIDRVDEFKKDAKLNDMLSKGNSIGCFYIESPAMRQLLIKLKCRDYITLVAASSIIRPGVAKSGMMKEYIQRHLHPETVKYIHPKMEEILKETYGVMVYQEDVIKVAYHFAGLDLAESDVLRRAMSGKFRSKDGFERIRDKFFRNCDERGYPRSISEEVWRQMESFSGYSFSKAHSASFAVESYQSLYLKAYYPLEFMVAVINNFGGFYRTEYYINEARLAGANIHHPCVNYSDYKTCIHDKDIFLGFVHIKDLERQTALAILEEREKHGPYASLADLCERVALQSDQLSILIKAKALRFIGKSKKALYWEGRMLLKKQPVNTDGTALFKPEIRSFSLPVLQDNNIEDAYDDIELFDFPLCHPFDMLDYDTAGCIDESEMKNHVGRQVKMTGYLITTKDVRTDKGGLMQFANYWDRHGITFDAVHFASSISRYPITGRGIYLLEGKVIHEYGVYNLDVQKLTKLPYIKDPRGQ